MDDEDVMVVTHSKDAIVGNDDETDDDQAEEAAREEKVEVHRRRPWHALKGCYEMLKVMVTADTKVPSE
jgi:hypothetical protein